MRPGFLTLLAVTLFFSTAVVAVPNPTLAGRLCQSLESTGDGFPVTEIRDALDLTPVRMVDGMVLVKDHLALFTVDGYFVQLGYKLHDGLALYNGDYIVHTRSVLPVACRRGF